MSEEHEHDPYLPHFDLSPGAFPWTPGKVQTVADARRLTGSLFFDELLGMAAVDASLYPPKDTLTLRHLINSILQCDFDRLKKDCLAYYLLLDYTTRGQAEIFRAERDIPARFARLTEGYWFLDNRQYEDAVKCLTLPSLTPDFVPKIIRTLSLHPTPDTAARLVLKFINFATPDLTTDEEVENKVDALARVNFREAWEFVESVHEGERKQQLVKRVIVATLSPKPVPAHLQLLLAFPFSASSEQTLHALALHPPSNLSQASTKVLHDLAHTRLIAQGRLLDAIHLDRAIGSGREGEKRRETIDRLVRIVPEVQRRILEVEMGGGEKEKAKANSTNDVPAPVASSSTSLAPAPAPAPAVVQQQHNLPLSASQALRASSPQLSVHRAILSPAAAAPASPGRNGSAPVHRPFSFPVAPAPSSPARSAFGNVEAAGSPFSNRTAFASSSSTRPVSSASLPAHYLPQRPQAPAAASPVRVQQTAAAAASPFAQAAKQASQSAYRSSLLNRDQRARQESPRFQQAYNRPVAHDEGDDEMVVVESPPPAAAKKRTAGRRTKEGSEKSASKSTRSTRRQHSEEPQEQAHEEKLEDEEDDTLPGAFPGSMGTSTSETPTTRKKAAPKASASKAAKPATRTTSTRGKRAPSVPGSFTTGAASDESDHDELKLEDLAPPATSTRRKTRAAPPPPASSSGYGLRHARMRSVSVVSDSEEDDLESQGKTPPPSMRKRTLRSSVTVSPEAVRRAESAATRSKASKAKGGSKLKEASTAAPTRRSTRRTAAADE